MIIEHYCIVSFLFSYSQLFCCLFFKYFSQFPIQIKYVHREHTLISFLITASDMYNNHGQFIFFFVHMPKIILSVYYKFDLEGKGMSFQQILLIELEEHWPIAFKISILSIKIVFILFCKREKQLHVSIIRCSHCQFFQLYPVSSIDNNNNNNFSVPQFSAS